jgi:FkbM family methyltransferase
MRRLGSLYGGYHVPMTLLSSSSVCYSAGIGEDITFDLELIEATQCQVFAFDPTARSIEHVKSLAAEGPQFHFLPLGLWHSDETVKFFAPQDRRHVSHSIVNLQKTRDYFEAPCKRLSSVMRELGHDRVDLLKLNIEGAQYAVIESIIEDNVPVRVLTVA